MLKIKKVLEEICCIIFVYLIVFFMFGILVYGISDGEKPSNNITICKNAQKLYKDDILFDNFYISCNDTTLEISKELYTRIIENEDYKITYNKIGGIYLVEKVKE